MLIIGAYPPPIGGNSVHIKRLRDELCARDICCDVADIYGMPDSTESPDKGVYRVGPAGVVAVWRAIGVMRKEVYDVIHFHVSATDRFVYAGLVLLLAMPGRAKSIVTVHSGSFSDNYRALPCVKKFLLRFVFRRFDRIITVNRDQQTVLELMGVDERARDVIPAYLPPKMQPCSVADRAIGRLRKDGRLLMITSGYGTPLYGYHTIIAAIKNSAALRGKVSLLLCIYNRISEPYMTELKHSIADLGFVEILYNLSPEQFAYTLSRGDLYIRATNTDGDAVAVREAANFGVPVLASDASERPSYCALFRTGDSSDLILRLREHLDSPRSIHKASDTLSSTADRIVALYLALGGR